MTQETYYSYDILATAIGGIVAYLTAVGGFIAIILQMKKDREERERATHQQEEDLRWRRAQFLIQLWKDFNADLTMRPCIRLVDEGDRNSQLSTIMKADPWTLKEDEAKIRYDFDRYFDFLESLAYCEQKGTLTFDEVECFGWHFEKILESETLAQYCSSNGYLRCRCIGQKDRSAFSRRLKEFTSNPCPNTSTAPALSVKITWVSMCLSPLTLNGG